MKARKFDRNSSETCQFSQKKVKPTPSAIPSHDLGKQIRKKIQKNPKKIQKFKKKQKNVITIRDPVQ